jgi:TP901 family phage tail tape measure protein
MSSTTTQWILELIDKVSQPLKNIDRYAKLSSHSVEGVDRLLDRINQKSTELSGSLKSMGLTALAFGALTYGSVQFEHGMARANTMASLGAKEISDYTNQIRGLSEVIPIAKTQLTEGLYATISAGVPKENWITFLKDSAQAAIGGNAELGLVVDATSSVIKAYGDSWDNATKIQDRFQKTVKLGQIPSLESLASALPRVTAVSSDLKISQDELLGVFATASGVMGKPAEVATQLNAVLSALMKPGAEATKMAEKLGIAFNASSVEKAGGLKNYIDFLMPRIQAFADKTGTTQQEIIGQLFGSQEAIKLVIGLGGNLAQSWGENTAQIANSAGSVQAAFDIMNATTTSKVQEMRNSFGNAMDGVYMALAPLAQFLIDGAAKVFQFIGSFLQAHPVLSKFVVIGGTALFAVIFLTTAISLLSLRLNAVYLNIVRASLSTNGFTAAMGKAGLASLGFFKSMWRVTMQLAGQAVGYALAGAYLLGSFLVGLISATAAQWGLNIAMNANPIGLIVIGIAAAVAAIVVMIKYWDEIKKAIVSFAQFVWKISPFKFLLDLVDTIFPGFKAKVAEIFEYVKGLVLGFWNKIKEVFGKIKSFFGFGDDTKTEIDVNVTKNESGVGVTGLNTDPNGLGLLIKPSGGDTTGTASASGSGVGKSITMNLDIKNYFNMAPGNWKDKIEDIADQVVGKINDRMRDATIVLD